MASWKLGNIRKGLYDGCTLLAWLLDICTLPAMGADNFDF
jgi:hypothetical protein